jgi:hypothetical protein
LTSTDLFFREKNRCERYATEAILPLKEFNIRLAKVYNRKYQDGEVTTQDQAVEKPTKKMLSPLSQQERLIPSSTKSLN